MDFILLICEKLGLSVVSFIIVILIGGLCHLVYKIATNHLSHVQSSLDRIEVNQKELHTKVDGLGERVSKIEGKLE